MKFVTRNLEFHSTATFGIFIAQEVSLYEICVYYPFPYQISHSCLWYL